MKQVVLIGDSIRMGYQAPTAERLADVALCWFPETNGSHSVNLLANLHAWVLRRPELDLLHINAGLHDLKTVAFDRPEHLVPLDCYRRNVRLLLETVRHHKPATRVIWALTTPVHDANSRAAHEKPRDFHRRNADVLAYNDAARQVCTDLNVPVHDLYAVVHEAGLERLQTSDGVHYTPAGYDLLADAVAKRIRFELSLT